jgi:DNA-binding HxlR family transcriptional regulator
MERELERSWLIIQDGSTGLLHALPFRRSAQDGTEMWLRHHGETIGSPALGVALVDQQNATPAQPASGGFLASHDHGNCKAELALRVIQGRWKLLILRELIDGVHRFSDLQRDLPGVSQKVLTAQLRELEADGVVARTVHPQVPPRVDYALKSLGRDLIPVLEGLHAFGEQVDGHARPSVLPEAEA